jgi:hypothetical protein
MQELYLYFLLKWNARFSIFANNWCILTEMFEVCKLSKSSNYPSFNNLYIAIREVKMISNEVTYFSIIFIIFHDKSTCGIFFGTVGGATTTILFWLKFSQTISSLILGIDSKFPPEQLKWSNSQTILLLRNLYLPCMMEHFTQWPRNVNIYAHVYQNLWKPNFFLRFCLFVYLFVCLFVCLSVCLFVCYNFHDIYFLQVLFHICLKRPTYM